jgi:uncharacterized phosphosugar-binding protein
MVTQPRFGMELFWQEAARVLERVVQTQSATIRRAAQLFADCLRQGGVIHAYGTGHSRAFAMELSYRAGGLVPVNRIDLAELAFHGWSLERVTSPDIERDLAAGQALLSCYQIQQPDAFIIASNSGINAAVVECARQIKERGHALVAVTSLEHTQQVASRHPSGKRLYELADLVIDNCGPFGDALLPLPGGGKACAVSSLTGALIAQMLTAETIGILLEQGEQPPIFLSANVPEGQSQNAALLARYAGRLHRSW